MGYDREDVKASVKRAGDDHWQRLVDHHEDAYPASPPTPGEVCRREGQRLGELGFDGDDWELEETRVEPSGSEVTLVHVLRHRRRDEERTTEPFTGYGG